MENEIQQENKQQSCHAHHCEAHKCIKVAKFGLKVLTLMVTVCIARQLHLMNRNIEALAREHRHHKLL